MNKPVVMAFDRGSVRSYDADGRLHVDQSGIYVITALSGSQYVGSAIHFGNRWKRHLTHLRSGNHHNSPLQRAFEKYGESGLSFDILQICAVEDLLENEQKAIDSLNPEYNICRVAGSQLGIKRSPETSAKMSEAQRRRAPPTAETLEKMRAARIGTIASEESRAKASAAMKAHYSDPETREACAERNRKSNSSQETRAKISAALIGKKKSQEARANMSAAQLGRPSKLKGVPRSDEVKAKITATKRANAERKKNASLE